MTYTGIVVFYSLINSNSYEVVFLLLTQPKLPLSSPKKSIRKELMDNYMWCKQKPLRHVKWNSIERQCLQSRIKVVLILTSSISKSRFCWVCGVHWRRTEKISGTVVLGFSRIDLHPGHSGSKKESSSFWQLSQAGGSTQGWIIGFSRSGL